MKKFLLLTLVMIGMTSCTTTYYVSREPEIKNALIGCTYQSVISAMGVPNRQTTDGEGGTILVYEATTSDSVATAYDVNYFTGTYTPGFRTTTHTNYVYVYMNSQGKCYDVQTNLTREETEIDAAGTIMSMIGSVFGLILLSII
ncbi:MAG: hypothetical protein E7134_02325 [Rikenellaceae bacterium]|nr:hypothetical protein [Rikenellaceae bacterium]